MPIQLIRLLLLLTPAAAVSQNAKIDSLKRVIETTKVDTVKGRTLCRLCGELRKVGALGDALSPGKSGLTLSRQLRDEVGEVICLNNLGIVYSIRGEYPLAMQHHQQCLTIRQKKGDRAGMASSLGNIALIYQAQSDYPRAIGYLEQCLEILEQNRDQVGVAASLNNLANIYESQGHYNQALSYYERGLRIMESIGNQAGVSNCLGNMGFIFHTQGDYERAFDCYERSLNIHTEMGNRIGIAGSLISIGGTSLKLNQFQRSRAYAQKGLRLAQQIGHSDYKWSGAAVLYRADSALGNWKAAFEAHQLFKMYSDSLKNDEQSKELGRLESKYEFEQQAEAEKRKAEAEARKEAERTERRNNLQYLSIFAGLIALFGGLVFLRRLRVPLRVVDVVLFAGLLVLFEFLLVLFDPWVDDWSGGVPLYKLVFNTGIAVVLAPVHQLAVRGLRKRLVAPVVRVEGSTGSTTANQTNPGPPADTP